MLRVGLVGGVSALVAGAVTAEVVRHRTQVDDGQAWASTVAPQAVTGSTRVVWSGPPTHRLMALTFDDGPTTQFTAQVLDLLAGARLQATFFVVGALAERHPDLLRRVRDEGHEIANHTYDHVSAALQDAPAVRDGVARCAEVIERLGGARPRWLRPPRGEITSATLLAARADRHDLALWSVVRGGPDGGTADDDEAGIRRHLSAAGHAGAIVDLHDGIGRSAFSGPIDQQLLTRRGHELAALPQVLSAWRDQGYGFATISELFAQD